MNILPSHRQSLSFSVSLSLLLLLSSCGDNSEKRAAEERVVQEQLAQQKIKDMSNASSNALSVVLTRLFEQYPLIEAGAEPPTFSEPSEQADGSICIKVRIPIIIKESIYHKEDVPAQLDDMRKAINESANSAMLPDALYLIQIGATQVSLLEEDKQVKPLPEELATKAATLQELTKGPVYNQIRQAGDAMELQATITLSQAEGEDVQVKDITLNENQLDFFEGNISEGLIPASDKNQIIHSDWLKERKEAIMAGITLFNTAAAPYIESREEAARALMIERKSALLLAEQAQKDELAAAKAQAEQLYAATLELLTTGKDYQGEWKRDKDFGKLGLKITKAEKVEESIHFVGSLYDIDLPEAQLDVSGRCALGDMSEGVEVLLKLYDGQYDPNQATAEVYDAKDGILVLQLNAEGKLQGIMSCESWEGQKEKEFTVSMSTELPAKEDAEAETEPAKEDKE